MICHLSERSNQAPKTATPLYGIIGIPWATLSPARHNWPWPRGPARGTGPAP
jgi:hypothetical protein